MAGVQAWWYIVTLCCLFTFSTAGPAQGSNRGVTHEDIRDAILSMVHMFRDLTDKLERHEYRERQLGEQLKKALSGMDKRERQQDSRLDALVGALRDIQVKLEENAQGLKEKEMYSVDGGAGPAWISGLDGRPGLESMEAKQDRLEALLNSLHHQVEEGKAEWVARLDQMENQLSNWTESAAGETRRALAEASEALRWELTSQSASLDDAVRGLSSLRQDISQKSELTSAQLSSGFGLVSQELKGLGRVEQVLVQTADHVMDAKRRVEYGVHQILLEVGDLVRNQGKELNQTVNTRFNDISTKILNNQNEGLTNLTSKVETEISQVWRQIGIMYQQLSASAGALDSLQKQTETYVNGSLSTMDGMESKVGLITGRMNEVDENLNYLLGRLSLVTQEFNLTKNALGQALDNIRTSFRQVKEKVSQQQMGPGPNPISEDASQDNVLEP